MEAARERAIAALAEMIASFAALLRGSVTGDGQDVVVDGNLDRRRVDPGHLGADDHLVLLGRDLEAKTGTAGGQIALGEDAAENPVNIVLETPEVERRTPLSNMSQHWIETSFTRCMYCL